MTNPAHSSYFGNGAIVPRTTQTPSPNLPDLSMMTPLQRDQLFLNVLAATVRETQDLRNRVDDLEEKRAADKEQFEAEREENKAEQQSLANELNELYKSKNWDLLNRLNSVIRSSIIADKEVVWKARVVAKILNTSPSTRPNDVEQAYLINRETRQQLRDYIEGYQRGFNSKRKPTLIAYAKLLLRDNPLYTWKTLSPLLDRAKEKITQDQPSYIQMESCLCYSGYEDCPGYYDNVDVEHYFELEPEKAAQRLFNDPDISAKLLWTEKTRRYHSSQDTGLDY